MASYNGKSFMRFFICLLSLHCAFKHLTEQAELHIKIIWYIIFASARETNNSQDLLHEYVPLSSGEILHLVLNIWTKFSGALMDWQSLGRRRSS